MNINRLLRLGVFAWLFFVSTLFAFGAFAAGTADDPKISGPYNSGNLSVFLIHGKDQLKGQTYLTLQEALAQKKVVVHETGDVNQLSVDNLCPSVVFIQSGDIVKGGRQDRTMQNDVLLQPNQKNVPLSAFCVEHGRWSGRAGEADGNFASSSDAIAGKELKLAAKKSANQSAVWSQVASYQTKLSQTLAKPVASPASPSSYQLTLENKNVKEATQKLVKDLQSAPNKDKDIVGYAFAINGRVNSAEVYASNDLFKKLWPKLLNSSAVEAVTEGKKIVAKPATAADVRACLADAEKAPRVAAKAQKMGSSGFFSYSSGAGGATSAAPEPVELNASGRASASGVGVSQGQSRAELYSNEDAKNIMFSTYDRQNKVNVHKSYVAK